MARPWNTSPEPGEGTRSTECLLLPEKPIRLTQGECDLLGTVHVLFF
jgi:hypothetical protein